MLLLNEGSIHEQFADGTKFREALNRFMGMVDVADRFNRKIYYSIILNDIMPVPGIGIEQAVRDFADRTRYAAVMRWVQTSFRNVGGLVHEVEFRQECKGQDVTQSGIGRVAFRTMNQERCDVISFTPSDWDFSPTSVLATSSGESESRIVELNNWRSSDELREELSKDTAPVGSWNELFDNARETLTKILLADGCDNLTDRVPYSVSAGKQLWDMMKILNDLGMSQDSEGKRSAKGEDLYNTYFVGWDPKFTDSSQKEKNEQRKKLTFPHPLKPGQTMFCPWHGKINQQIIRVHFSWPQKEDEERRFCIVYVGPKLTKK